MWKTGQYTQFSGATQIGGSPTVLRTVDERPVPASRTHGGVSVDRRIGQPGPPPTLVTRFVDCASTAGGNGTTNATAGANRAYASLQEALNAMEATLWASLNQKPTIQCGGSTADTTDVSFGSGWGNVGHLSSTSFLTIQGNQPSALNYSTAHYRQESTISSGVAFALGTPSNVKLYDLAWKHTVTVGPALFPTTVQIGSTSPLILFERCQLRGVVSGVSPGAAKGFEVFTGDGLVIFVNCVVSGYKNALNPTNTAISIENAVGTIIQISNCTVADCDTGITSLFTAVIDNTGVTGTTTPYPDNGSHWSPASHNNASNSTDAPGTSPRNSVTAAFFSSTNLHLASTDTAWRDQAVPMVDDGVYPFTTDGNNAVRSGTWDIGADEAVVTIVPLQAVTGAQPVVGARLATRVALQTAVCATPVLTANLGFIAAGPTTVTRYVNSAASPGGNGTTTALTGANAAYTSLGFAVSSELTAGVNLTSGGRNCVLRFLLQGTGDQAGNIGSGLVNFDIDDDGVSFTVDSTHYVVIEQDSATRHAGVFDGAKGKIGDAAQPTVPLIVRAPHLTRFIGLQFESYADNYFVTSQTSIDVVYWYFTDCIFQSQRSTAGSFQYAINLQGGLSGTVDRRIYLRNCVFAGKMTRAISLIYAGDLGGIWAYNVTAVGMTEYVFLPGVGSGTTLEYQNVIAELASGAAGECFYGGFSGVWTNSLANISSDATSPQTALRNITLTYTNKSGFDFHLASVDTAAINAGVDTSTTVWPVTTDISGVARPSGAAYDIGAFERVSTGATVALQTVLRIAPSVTASLRTRVALQATVLNPPRVTAQGATRVQLLTLISATPRVVTQLATRVQLATAIRLAPRVLSQLVTRVQLTSVITVVPRVVAQASTRVALQFSLRVHPRLVTTISVRTTTSLTTTLITISPRVLATVATRVALQATVRVQPRVPTAINLRVPLTSTVRVIPLVVATGSTRVALRSLIEINPRVVSSLATRVALNTSIRISPRALAALVTRVSLGSLIRAHPRVLASASTRLVLSSVIGAHPRITASLLTRVALRATSEGHPRVSTVLATRVALRSLIGAQPRVFAAPNVRIALQPFVVAVHPRVLAFANIRTASLLNTTIRAHGLLSSTPLFVSGGVPPTGGRTEVSIIST